MQNLLFISIGCVLLATPLQTFAKDSAGRTHVFWYKAKTNHYSLTDCNPGPCLPKGAIIHEELIVTTFVTSAMAAKADQFKLGFHEETGAKFMTYIWSKKIHDTKYGRAKSVLFRGEYSDHWLIARTTCTGGVMNVRCGVVDYAKTIEAYGGPQKAPEAMMWIDQENEIREVMGFNERTSDLMAQETKQIVVPPGSVSRTGPSPLDGRFFEIDITRQVNWILQHPVGQYAIVFIPIDGKGKITLHSSESGNNSLTKIKGSRRWTQDGNTAHIVIKEDPVSPLVFEEGPGSSAKGMEPGAPIEWIRPEPYSVIKVDTVVLEVAVRGEKARKDVKKITFYAAYFDSNLSWHKNDTIYKARSAPFRVTWDCSHIADHSQFKIFLSCDIFRENAPDSTIVLKRLVLDRNPLESKKALKSYPSKMPVVFDGLLNEWPRNKGASFGNGDNQIKMLSQWDSEFLYFGIEVLDTNIISRFPPNNPEFAGLYNEDEIELLIDPFYKREELVDSTLKHFLIAAAGRSYQVVWHQKWPKPIYMPKIKCAVRAAGTLNETKDRDTGYVIEYAIPWSEIGILPQIGKTMGLEIWNTDIDLDSIDDVAIEKWIGTKSSSFAQSSPTTLQNPSEWGRIKLCAERKGYLKWALAGFALVVISVLVVVVRRKKVVEQKGATLEEKIKTAEMLLKKAEGIATNVGDKREYLSKLEESNRELEEFARIASHDLQEPLRKIESFGDRLHSRIGEKLDRRDRDYLSRMQSASSRMRELVNGLLTLSRVSSKAEPFKSVSLNSLIAEVVLDLQSSIERANAKVERADLPFVEADPMQMRQLFQNLIGNAIKFRREEVDPVVKIESRLVLGPQASGQRRWKISIADNGIGFEQKYADRIFETFERLHGRSSYEGTGLGLAICRKIVERHGGTIRAESQPGEGTTFIIELPEKQLN